MRRRLRDNRNCRGEFRSPVSISFVCGRTDKQRTKSLILIAMLYALCCNAPLHKIKQQVIMGGTPRAAFPTSRIGELQCKTRTPEGRPYGMLP